MEVIRAKNAGFCFGVKRAIESAYDELKKTGGKIYSIGPLIHNEKVTSDLKQKGLIELNDISEIEKLTNQKVILRTHGIEKKLFDKLIENKNEIIDLTCPFVKKIHTLASEYSEKGYTVLVIGDKNHPEVKGIVSYIKGDYAVLLSEDDIRGLHIDKKTNVLVLFQTTANAANAQKLVDILAKLSYNIKVINTICNATESRQKEVSFLAEMCDLMFIVGSKNSSNTMKLFEIAKKKCEKSYFLESKDDLENVDLKNVKKIGISAGASTPDYLIEEILTDGRIKF